MRKSSEELSLPGAFVKCPVVLLTHGRLTPTHRNLWLVLEAHCMSELLCFPSITRLAKLLNLSARWVKTLLADLERLGYLTRNFQRGKCTIYYPQIPVNPGSTLPPPDQTQEVHFTTPVNCSSPHPGSTLHPETDKRNRRKKQSTEPSVRNAGKPKPKKPTDPNVKPILDYFCSAYKEKFGAKYSVSGARDGAIIKGLLTDHSPETLKRCIDAFFTDSDPWLDGKYNLPVFRSRINQYVQATATKTPEQPRQSQRLRDVTY